MCLVMYFSLCAVAALLNCLLADLSACAAPTCCYEGNGKDYIGATAITMGGEQCMRWSEMEEDTDGIGMVFPDASLSEAENFCRNPDDDEQPWCYVDSDELWNFCDVRNCAECRLSELHAVLHAVRMVGGHAYMDSVDYMCDAGFEFPDETTQMTVHCQQNTTWSPHAHEQCQRINCGIPALVAYADANFSGTEYEDSVLYECRLEYAVDAANAEDRSFLAVCLSDKTWSATPACIQVECGAPPSISHAVQTQSTGVLVNSTTTYACEEGFAINLNHPNGKIFFSYCMVTGIWSPVTIRCIAGEDCPKTLVGSSIGLQILNFKSGSNMIIFVDKTFKHPGKLSTWRYLATRSGEAYFSVWRRSGDSVRLIGFNRVSAPWVGLKSHSVPVSEQISVERGDMIGVYYPRTAITYYRGKGILYFEDSRPIFDSTPGIDGSEFSHVISKSLYADDLEIGKDIIPRISHDVTRQVALEAVTECDTCIKTVMGCSIGLHQLIGHSDSFLNIFMSKTFGHRGVLFRWRYLGYRSGEVYFSVWRKTRALQLIGFNKVFSSRKGLQDYNVPASEQIRVEFGDVIGVHYPAEAASTGTGVLYYEDIHFPTTPCTDGSEPSGLVAIPMFDDELVVGRKIFGSIRMDIEREVTIAADVLTTSDCFPDPDVKP